MIGSEPAALSSHRPRPAPLEQLQPLLKQRGGIKRGLRRGGILCVIGRVLRSGVLRCRVAAIPIPIAAPVSILAKAPVAGVSCVFAVFAEMAQAGDRVLPRHRPPGPVLPAMLQSVLALEASQEARIPRLRRMLRLALDLLLALLRRRGLLGLSATLHLGRLLGLLAPLHLRMLLLLHLRMLLLVHLRMLLLVLWRRLLRVLLGFIGIGR